MATGEYEETNGPDASGRPPGDDQVRMPPLKRRICIGCGLVALLVAMAAVSGIGYLINRAKRAEVWARRGRALLGAGEFARSAREFEKATDIKPDYVEAYFLTGIAYWQQEKYEQAIAAFTRAIENDPEYIPAYIRRAWAYHRSNNGDRAMRDLATAQELNPDDSQIYLARGTFHFLRGNADHAIADLDVSVRLDPDCADAYYWRGRAYARKGDLDRARSELKKVRGLPTSPSIRQEAEAELRRLNGWGGAEK